MPPDSGPKYEKGACNEKQEDTSKWKNAFLFF